MSNATPAHFLAAQKASFEAMFDTWTKVFDGSEQITKLNIQLAKSAFAENHGVAEKGFSTINPLHFFAPLNNHAHPAAEKFHTYCSRILEIASGTQRELAATAGAQFQRYHREAQGILEDLTKSISLANQTTPVASK